MRRKKPWLFVSLALIGCLALGVALLRGGSGPAQAPAAQKMSPALQMLCALYRDFGATKLGQVTRSQLIETRKSAGSPEQQMRLTLLQKLAGWDVDRTRIKKSRRDMAGGGLEQFFDPVLARRWNNPAFDVAGGVITASENPRGLESPYLKVRRPWQKDGKWHAFCEFAVHKAEEIASQPAVSRLGILPVPRPENDLGSASTDAPRLRVGTPGDWDAGKGFTGAGVIVGDVDTGIDWAHGDFLNPDGSTRILYIWDTSIYTAGRTPEDLFGMTGFNYGTVWTKTEIDGGLCQETDTSGHGTHTCGTAAGNGGATGNYTGMAPNADIICVKGLDPYGVEFVFEMARQLGRPAVVNNSWGLSWYPYGPFFGIPDVFPGDGTDEYSDYFDFLAGLYPKGSIIVKSAGNNGMWHTYRDHDDYGFALYNGSLHFGGRTNYGRPIGHIYHRINHDFGQGMYLEYSDLMIRSNTPVQVTIKFLATGQSFTMQTGGVGQVPGAAAQGFPSCYYSLALGQDPNNGEHMGFIWMEAYPGQTMFPEGDWTILVTPLNPNKTAKYDMWLYSARLYYNSPYIYNYFDSCFRRFSSHDEYQLDWAASPDVFTVGAWTTRSYYDAADGHSYYPWGFLEPKRNTITYFSSPGPARDGRLKPDIAAPGAVIMSAASGDAGWTSSELDPDLLHGWMWGTSMAAPHATGGIALYLQKFPGHNLTNVRTYLGNWARNDAHTKAIGRKGFGTGKLNVSGLKSKPVAVLGVDRGTVKVGQAATFSAAGSYDPDKLPIKLKWTLLVKPTGSASQIVPNGNIATLVPDKPGTYKVGLVVQGVILNSATATATVKAVQ